MNLEKGFFAVSFFCYAISTILYPAYLFIKPAKIFTHSRLILRMGLLFHTFALILRVNSIHTLPVSNTYEAFSFAAWVLVLIFSIIEQKWSLASLGTIVAPFAFFSLAYASVLPQKQHALVPFIKNHWVEIHITLSLLSYATFILAFGASLSYFLQEKLLKQKKSGILSTQLPALTFIDELCSKLVVFGFSFFTLGLITGILLQESQWGILWVWEPKQTASFLTWMIYGIYLYTRKVAGWKGRKSHYFLIAGFVAVLVTFLGINVFVPSGRHRFM